jgi:phosphonate transport system substrate-binding protein
MKQIMHSIAAAFVGCALYLAAPVRAADQVFTVAVVPQFASIQTFRDWAPFLSKLEQATGYHFKLLAYDQPARFEMELGQGNADLAFMNPYQMVVAQKMQHYRPLLRDSSPLSGILVARQDSAVKSPADLNGKRVAFPSPNALAASLYMRALLAEKMDIKIIPVYVGSHQNVYRQVILGDVVAGGGVKKTLAKESAEVQSELKVIFSTPDLAPHPLAAHPRVSKAAENKIVEAILAMQADPEGAKLLNGIQIPQPIKADFKRDYAGLSQLKLDRYADNQAQ